MEQVEEVLFGTVTRGQRDQRELSGIAREVLTASMGEILSPLPKEKLRFLLSL